MTLPCCRRNLGVWITGYQGECTVVGGSFKLFSMACERDANVLQFVQCSACPIFGQVLCSLVQVQVLCTAPRDSRYLSCSARQSADYNRGTHHQRRHHRAGVHRQRWRRVHLSGAHGRRRQRHLRPPQRWLHPCLPAGARVLVLPAWR